VNPRRYLAILGGLALALHVAAVHGEPTWPSRPVKVLVGFAPGTGSDIAMRIFGRKLGELLGQPVVVENRPGAAGVLAMQAGAKAPPDGYTLTLATTSTLITGPALSRHAHYHPDRDFVAVAPLARSAFIVVASADRDAPKSLAELVATLRARPSSYASPGTGTVTHLVTELFLKRVGVTAQHVPYKGSTQALGDVAGSHLLFATDTVAAAIPLIRSGRLRALAVTGRARVAALPDVPTFAESGIAGLDDVALDGWMALLAPAGTPPGVIRLLNDAASRAIDSNDVRASLRSLELEPFTLPPEAFADFLEQQTPVWIRFIHDSGIRAND
jgi:tripartite-type tricarboxylate transporter receptor subunit TctC